MARYDDLEYEDHDWLLGRDEAAEIVKRADGAAMALLEEVLAFCRDREESWRACESEKIGKEPAAEPNPGWSCEALGAKKMEAEYIADCIQSIIGRVSGGREDAGA